MHIAWPEIESFHNVRKAVACYPELLSGRRVVSYRGKVKLHGTNAAIRVKGDNVSCQSRTTMISVRNDNLGFAAWVETVKDEWIRVGSSPVNFARDFVRNGFIVFGEWCGPGIMNGVAVNRIPKKMFAVFAIQSLDAHGQGTDELIVEPDKISKFLLGSPQFALTDVKVIPWHTDVINIEILAEPCVVQTQLDDINKDVAEVEAMDPFIKQEFNVEGIGEGIVYYPISHPGRKHFGDLCFKAKGEKHKNIAKAKPAQLDPSVAQGVTDFVEMVLTTARLEQGARAIAKGELKFENGLMGPFMKWVNNDVLKECVEELAASGIDRRIALKAVSAKARNWYLAEMRKL